MAEHFLDDNMCCSVSNLFLFVKVNAVGKQSLLGISSFVIN